MICLLAGVLQVSQKNKATSFHNRGLQFVMEWFNVCLMAGNERHRVTIKYRVEVEARMKISHLPQTPAKTFYQNHLPNSKIFTNKSNSSLQGKSS